MARVASVLGLVMLSVALLILSLISYVSLKKENIFTTPKYANPGAPRMYMFHAGFRSQFALKFLDPSFVPITNSLTHELQEKPSKWTFNRTAFLHQRQEILQHVDVIKNFSLTKNSVRIGQLMHYDYSSHKYVFSISNNFRSLLPDVSPIMNKRYNVCAVVGNSGILTGSQCGQEIDKSDFGFRCNFAPTEAFQKDVGRKTNLTTFNPSILEKYYNNLLTIQDRNNFFLSLKKLDGAILWIPAFFFHTSATVTRTLVDFFVEHREPEEVELSASIEASVGAPMLTGLTQGPVKEQEPAGTSLSLLLRSHWKAGRLTNPATTQAQNQHNELAHPNIHLIYELLEHVKGPDLQIQSCRMSTTQDNKKISRRSPSEGPVLIM
ncbi:ST8 alpha-N-acetyl-neuraminide alpha-28-sialyltransferase 3 [Cricetulus griseus]